MEKLTEFSLFAPARCVAEDVLSPAVVDDVDVVEVCSMKEDKSSETELHLVSCELYCLAAFIMCFGILPPPPEAAAPFCLEYFFWE